MTTFLLIRHAATDYAGHTLVGRRPAGKFDSGAETT